MLENVTDLQKVTAEKLDEFNGFCEIYELAHLLKADHIGIKCSSEEKYEFQRNLFDFESEFIYQSIISKRRITIVGLKGGLESMAGSFRYLEIADQKPDLSQVDFVDHLEVVSTSLPYDELIATLREKGVILQEMIKPHHTTYDTILPSGFIVKFSREMLLEKIKREEMK